MIHHIVVKTAPVPHRRAHRPRQRLQPAQPHRRAWSAPRRSSPPCSSSRRSASPASRRSRGSSRSSRSSTPASPTSQYAVVGVSLVVSLLTLFAMIRIWTGAFWSPPEDDDARDAARIRRSRAAAPSSWSPRPRSLVACSLAVAAAAGPIYAFSERTADDLLDRDGYIEEVLGPMRIARRIVAARRAVAARVGRDQPRQRPQRRRRRRRAARRLPAGGRRGRRPTPPRGRRAPRRLRAQPARESPTSS